MCSPIVHDPPGNGFAAAPPVGNAAGRNRRDHGFVHIHNFPKFISAGAGIDMDEDKITLAAKRYRTLVRAINISRGMRRKDEKPPENPWKKRFPELEKEES